MRIFTLTIFFQFLTIISPAQGNSKSGQRHKPKDLNEAVLQLEKILRDTVKQKILVMTEERFLEGSHRELGMWIRNNWALWRGGKLSRYFNSMEIFHPDDMSAIILRSYYRQLHGKDWELEKQVKYYQDEWKASNEHFNRLKTDTAYQRQVREAEDSLKSERLNSF